jgi:hypothetical protein
MTIQMKSTPAKVRVTTQPAPIRQSFSALDVSVLLTEAEAAEVCNVTGQTFKKWRLYAPGKGPTPTYMHGRVRYRVKAVREWLDRLTPSAA